MIPRFAACFAIVIAASLMACQTPIQAPAPTFEAGVEYTLIEVRKMVVGEGCLIKAMEYYGDSGVSKREPD